MPPNANFWQVGLLDVVLSEYPDKSHNFRNFIFMTSHFSTLLGAVSDMFENYAGKLNVTIRLEVIQKAALLGTAGLLRKVLAI